MQPCGISIETAIDLRRALARISRRLRTGLAGERLSGAKHSILGHLFWGGPATPGALAAAEGVRPQSLTRVLAELERSKLASRRRDALDRRQFLMEITPLGRELLEREARRRALWLAAAMDSRLSPTEQEMLRLASRLIDRLAEFEGEAGCDSEVEIQRELAVQ